MVLFKPSVLWVAKPNLYQASARVLRGGSWYFFGRVCRSAGRNRYEPGFRYQNVGFRLVLRREK